MSAEALISRLDRVRQNGNGRWSARCPAHEDRSPSLTVRQLEDGRTLVHCFGGCDTEAVLGAVGLTFADLFPDTQPDRQRRERLPFPASDVLRAIPDSLAVVVLVAGDLRRGVAVPEDDLASFDRAVEQLAGACRHGLGRQ